MPVRETVKILAVCCVLTPVSAPRAGSGDGALRTSATAPTHVTQHVQSESAPRRSPGQWRWPTRYSRLQLYTRHAELTTT